MSGRPPVIETIGLGKSFAGLRAVSNVTFSAQVGEIVGVIGPNGAGKTTLFNLISGAVAPDHGVVRLHGRDVTRAPFHARARLGVVRTFQTPRMFESLSCIENVMVGALLHQTGRRQARESASAAMELLGISRPWDRPVRELNLESRRLLEMARLIATKAKVILLDEPLAGLNALEIDRTFGALRTLRQERGMTFVIIEHHMAALAALCDRLMALHFGEVIAEGTPRAVTEDRTVREVYLGQAGA